MDAAPTIAATIDTVSARAARAAAKLRAVRDTQSTFGLDVLLERVGCSIKDAAYRVVSPGALKALTALGKVTTECVDSVERLCNKNTYHGGDQHARMARQLASELESFLEATGADDEQLRDVRDLVAQHHSALGLGQQGPGSPLPEQGQGPQQEGGADVLHDKFHCALLRDKGLLIQGRLHVYGGHVEFRSPVGSPHKLHIPYKDMTLVKKESYCWVPNSIVIERGAFSYFLTSFLSRNAAYDLIIRLRDKRLGDSSRSETSLHHPASRSSSSRGSSDADPAAQSVPLAPPHTPHTPSYGPLGSRSAPMPAPAPSTPTQLPYQPALLTHRPSPLSLPAGATSSRGPTTLHSADAGAKLEVGRAASGTRGSTSTVHQLSSHGWVLRLGVLAAVLLAVAVAVGVMHLGGRGQER